MNQTILEFKIKQKEILKEDFMKIKIDNTKINGKLIFSLFQPHWICKFVFLASLAFLINGDLNKKANVLGANNAGYMPIASSSFPGWESTHSRLDTDYN